MKYNLLTTAIVAMALLTACSSDEEGQADRAGSRMSLNGYIGGNGSTTRVAADGTGSTWEANDAIGIYVSGNGNSDYTNKQYTTAAGGATAAFNAADSKDVYLVSSGSVSITGYYPYIEDAQLSDGVYNFSIADADGNYVVNDFMWATNTVTRGEEESQSVDLAFNHKMRRLLLDFSNSELTTLTDETVITCSIDGIVTDGTFNTTTGVVSTLAVTGNVVVTGTGKKVYLIYPAQSTTNVALDIALGDVHYTATIPTLETGTDDNTTISYNVTIKGEQVQLTLGSISAAGWNSSTPGSIDAEKKEKSTSSSTGINTWSNGGSITTSRQ